MRIWDVSPTILCRQHLLGEHRELHALWSILVNGKKGYRNHPETKRWVGKLKALYNRHELLVIEMTKRGYTHKSNIKKEEITGMSKQKKYLESISKQLELLKAKNCGCIV